jgi:hypothetical protein
MLASRFAYVTPSGVVSRCRGLEPSQLIDGGYSDNTGLGTVVDLAPLWTNLVRAHNDAVLEQGHGQLVVPMVVFLDNGTGADYTLRPGAEPGTTTPSDKVWWPRTWAIPEVLVPIVGSLSAKNHKVQADTGLAASAKAIQSSLCTAGSGPCTMLQGSAEAAHPVFVVHQNPQPSIPAPLGWVLSKASQSDLDADMKTQATTGRADLPHDPASKLGYGTLHDLLQALGLAKR